MVQEEMRRVLAFQESKAKWWIERAQARAQHANSDILAGIFAYAHKQAYLCLRFGRHCASLWKPVLAANSLSTESWPAYYAEKYVEAEWEQGGSSRSRQKPSATGSAPKGNKKKREGRPGTEGIPSRAGSAERGKEDRTHTQEKPSGSGSAEKGKEAERQARGTTADDDESSSDDSSSDESSDGDESVSDGDED